MTTKKASPQHIVPSAYLQVAKGSLARIAADDVLELRKTPSGRPVALSFVEAVGKRPTNIYLDELLTAARGREERAYVVPARTTYREFGMVQRGAHHGRTVKRAAKKAMPVARKKAMKKVGGDYVKNVRGEMFVEVQHIPAVAENIEPAVFSSSLKKFAIHFIDNIRRLICPRPGTKPTVGVTATTITIALGAWISGHLGIHLEIAKAVAGSVLTLIAKATKGAFCDSANDWVKPAILKA